MVGQNENLKATFKRQMYYPQKNERSYCNKPKKYKDEFDIIQYINEVINLKCQQIIRKCIKKKLSIGLSTLQLLTHANASIVWFLCDRSTGIKCINPFFPQCSLLIPLKTENQRFSDVFWGI